jgi:hypothetical protein
MRQLRGQGRRISGSIRLDRVRELAVFLREFGILSGSRVYRSEFVIACLILDSTVYPLHSHKGGCCSELEKCGFRSSICYI